MSDIWRVIYDLTTGEPKSIGTDAVSPRDGCGVVGLSAAEADALLSGDGRWDAASRAVVPVVPPPLPEVSVDQLVAWMRGRMTADEVDAAIREAAGVQA